MTSHTYRCIGAGQTGRVCHFTPSTVLKRPWEGSEADIEVEQHVYERLGPHPRILKYLGPGPIPRNPKPVPRSLGIRLEYQPRGTVREVVISGSEVYPFKWAEQIAEGVELLHRNGIVHCDISASNVLITDSLDAVLCDFAAASIDGRKVNGIYYEQRCLRRDDYSTDFNRQDDIFAFGTVLYELSTRKRPYEDKTDEDVRQLYMKREFPDVSDLEMGNIIAQCWQDGYTSISEVLADIRKALRINLNTIHTNDVSVLPS